MTSCDQHFKTKLEKICQCPICLDVLKDPKILNCQHTFCRICLERSCLQNDLGLMSLFCPTCRARQPLVYHRSDVARVNGSLFVNQVLDLLLEWNRRSPPRNTEIAEIDQTDLAFSNTKVTSVYEAVNMATMERISQVAVQEYGCRDEKIRLLEKELRKSKKNNAMLLMDNLLLKMNLEHSNIPRQIFGKEEFQSRPRFKPDAVENSNKQIKTGPTGPLQLSIASGTEAIDNRKGPVSTFLGTLHANEVKSKDFFTDSDSSNITKKEPIRKGNDLFLSAHNRQAKYYKSQLSISQKNNMECKVFENKQENNETKKYSVKIDHESRNTLSVGDFLGKPNNYEQSGEHHTRNVEQKHSFDDDDDDDACNSQSKPWYLSRTKFDIKKLLKNKESVNTLCWRCFRSGHTGTKCNSETTARGRIICRKCNFVGHQEDNCTA